jgi:hypothetical protein
MGLRTHRRLPVACLAACVGALLAGCGANAPVNPPPSSNPVAAGAANTTSAPAYGADIQAAENISSVVSKSAHADVGATGP